MWERLLAILAILAAMSMLQCDGDDDDDDDDSGVNAQQICDRAAQCGLGDEWDVGSMDECLDFVASLDEATLACLNAATDCDELAGCVNQPGDDDDDDLDDDADDDVEPPPDTFNCEDAGLTVRDFVDAPADKSLYAVAADFTVPTMNGDWNFQEHFTGCESYLFVQNKPRQEQSWGISIWERQGDVHTLLTRLPGNTHVFFASVSSDEDQRNADFEPLIEQVDQYLATLSQEEQDRWWHRIHYVTVVTTEMESWLGELMTSPRWGFGIDRLQRIRYIGSYADYSRYDSGEGWFGPNLGMAANEAIYYNFESDREDALAAEEADVVTLYDGDVVSDPAWAGERTFVDVTLPDAATMAGYDSAELDLYLGCVGEGEFGTCPAWDYINSLYLCDADTPTECDTEFGRWITTYHREGRWVHDVSPLLPLIAEGGERRFAFYSQQPYEVYLSLRLFNAEKSVTPYGSEYLFSGGAFDTSFDNLYAETDINIPADATKVELATVISGHGQVSPGTCAEFCETVLHFFVNGTEHVISYPVAGTSTGCMEQVDEGTVPNQYGTWWYGRNGWCPGKEVRVETLDITAEVTAGEAATFDLTGEYDGAPYPTAGANIDMTSWVVFSK